jgi:glutamine synthetase
MDVKKLKKLVADNEVKAIDLRYCGLDGKWYHISFPARRLDFVLERGVPFDGSSIPGMRTVESGDMVLMPDITSAHIDPYFETPTLALVCSICDPETRIGVKKDPRSVAQRAHDYLLKTGIADTSLWIPELEFHLLDSAEFMFDEFSAGYTLTSTESKDALPEDFDDGDGVSQQDMKGYHMNVPLTAFMKSASKWWKSWKIWVSKSVTTITKWVFPRSRRLRPSF